MKRNAFLALTARVEPWIWATLCAVITFSGTTNARAASVFSDFQTGIDGWRGYSCPNPGDCTGLGPGGVTVNHNTIGGGSPSGGGDPEAGNAYIDTIDPGSTVAARVEPNPDKFGTLYAVGVTLSFDALVRTNGGGGKYDLGTFGAAPLVAIEMPGAVLVYTTSDLPQIDGKWKHYDVPLVNSPNWFLVTSQGISNPNVEQFATVIFNRSRLTLISEWLKEGAEVDSGGIDNFQVVPIPATLPLLGSAALFCMRFARRKAV